MEVAMVALKIRKVGGSLGVILPKEALEYLKVGETDTLFLTETADGYRVTNADPEVEQQLAAARKMAKKWRPLLRELAK
jgi:putative addiction module antidote